MKTIVVFYSRTNNTKLVANIISKMLKCDIEEIIDTRNREGFFGYIRAGYESTFKKLTVIKKTKYNSSKYDLVIIGTPVWAGLSSPVRTYLSKNKNLKKVAFFCTMGGSGNKRTFRQMEGLSKKPLATLTLTERELKTVDYQNKIKTFVDTIN